MIEIEGARAETSLPVPALMSDESDESVLATFDAAIRRALDFMRVPRRPAARPASPPMPVLRTDSATPAFGIRRSRPAATPTPATVAEPTLRPARRPTEPLPPPIVGSDEAEHTPIAVPLPMNEPGVNDHAHDSELRELVKHLEVADSALDALRAAPDRDAEGALRAVDLHAQSENLERAFARRLEPIARALMLVEERLARIEERLDATRRATG